MNAAQLAKAIDPKAKGRPGRAWSVRCPAHDDKRPSLSIRDGSEGVLLTCHAGCERRDIIAELQRRGLWPGRAEQPVCAKPKPASKLSEPEQYDALAPWGMRLWEAYQPIQPGTIAAAYLECRGCALPPPEGDLRWCAGLRHPSGHTGPCLVGLITDARTALPISLHRTWITADGSSKAPLDKPRLYLGRHRKTGGVVRLWPDDAVTLGLAVAEGIETALAAARVFTPVWATLDAGNLASFPVLPGIEALTIFADHDTAGQRAAEELADRYAVTGCDVWIDTAEQPGADFNDIANGKAA